MLCALSVGLASGVGLYALAIFSTVFLVVLLGIIESFEKGMKKFDLTIKAGDQTDELRPKIEAILRRFKLPHELRASADDELCYEVAVPLDARAGSRDRRHPAARSGGPRGRRLVGKEEQGEVATVKLIIQPDEGLTPLLQAVKRAKQSIDIVIFRFDRSGAREGARRGSGPRRDGSRAHRPHQPRRREEPQKAGDAAAGRGRHRRANGRRPHALSQQDDDRRRLAARPGIQLHAARYRAQPQLRRRHARQAPRQGGRARSSRPTAAGSRTHQATTASSSVPRAPASCSTAFLSEAKKQLLIYDVKVSDRMMLRTLEERHKAGVEIRIIGKVDKELAGGRDAEARRPPPARPRDHP